MEIQFWIHKDGWLYAGDETEGARLASEEEVKKHQIDTSKKDNITERVIEMEKVPQ